MKSTRKAYGEYLADIGAKRNDVVVLDADLAKATCTLMFKEKYPNRHFDIGIAEQDMVGEACGMAIDGNKVFASSFAMFLAGRAYEQIRNTAAYSNVDVNFCATHAGLAVGEDGATHQCLEDIALMRTMPNMKVMSTSDDTQTKWAIKEISKLNGPVYVRLSRAATPVIYDENEKFEIGKAVQIGKGTDATIFATGDTVAEAIKAKEMLEKLGKFVRVVDIHTIKPIDIDMIRKCAKETEILVSVEDHNVINGLGTAIADVLTEYYPKKLIKLGIKDTFGKSGKAEELMEYFGINANSIVEKMKQILSY